MSLNRTPRADATADGHGRLAPSAEAARAARAARACGARPVVPLARGCEREALDFLSARPVHTVVMSSLIRDHGLESAHNRGKFFGCRDAAGRLEGVALIGHVTMCEARGSASLGALARAARSLPRPYLIVGERAGARRFWSAYSRGRAVPCRAQGELLFEQRRPVNVPDAVPDLRRARPSDAALVVEAHAAMAERESGVNPLASDAEGFAERAARRIEAGRVWVWMRDGRLVFKADVAAETPDVVYLEGVYVHPEERGRGLGLRCLTQISRELLARGARVCLLVGADNTRAQSFYRRAGYKLLSRYDAIFPQPEAATLNDERATTN